jgi:HK97 family phage prohead protease
VKEVRGVLQHADPGWQADRRARYPIDTLEHAQASLAALEEPSLADRYPPRRFQLLRNRVRRAVHRLDPNRTFEGVGEVARSGLVPWNRSFALDDIQIQRSGDGRTVEAYAAMFDQPYEVQDQFGHYMESIDRAAFNRTLSNGAGKTAMCLYNHGMTVHGTADALSSVPLGTPLEIRADKRGLLTVTRYNKSALADSVLEAIRNGDIRSQSFRGRIVRSSPDRVPSVRRGGPLPTIIRHELGLTDYGPTPIPVNAAAEIVAVRSLTELKEDFAALDDDGRLEFLRSLGLDSFLDEGDDEDDEDYDDASGEDDLEDEDDVEDDDTPTSAQAEPGAEDPPVKALRSAAHIARRIRAEMIRRGMA